jgi:hypothetical protein
MPSGVCVACCLLHAVGWMLHRCRFHCRGAYCLVGLGTSAAGSDDGLNRLSSPAVVGAVRTRAACNMQHATDSTHCATYSRQHTPYNRRHATCNMQGAACNVQHASESFIEIAQVAAHDGADLAMGLSRAARSVACRGKRAKQYYTVPAGVRYILGTRDSVQNVGHGRSGHWG